MMVVSVQKKTDIFCTCHLRVLGYNLYSTKTILNFKAHRTLIVRCLKGLQKIIDVAVVHYLLTENGILIFYPLYFRLAFR